MGKSPWKLLIFAAVVSVSLLSASLLAACSRTVSTSSPTQAPATTFKPVKLVYITHLGPTDDTSVGMLAWEAEVTKRTNGAVTFENHWSASLVPAQDGLKAVSSGMADLAWLASPYYPASMPLTSLFGILFVTSKPDVMHKAITELYKTSPELREELKSQNVMAIGGVSGNIAGWATGPVLFGGKNPKVTKLEDMKGRKVRAVGLTGLAVSMMGGTPVSTTGGDMYAALERGTVDSVIVALMHHEQFKLVENEQFIADMGMGMYNYSYTAINLDKWNSLQPEIQKIIDETAAIGPKAGFDYWSQGEAERFIAAQKRGIEMYRLPDSELKRIRDAVLPAYWDKAVADQAKLNPAATKVFQQYVDLVKKYEATSTYVSPFEKK